MAVNFNNASWNDRIISIKYKYIDIIDDKDADFKKTCECRMLPSINDKQELEFDLKYKAFFSPKCFFSIVVEFNLIFSSSEPFGEISDDEVKKIISPLTRKFSYIVGLISGVTYSSPLLTGAELDKYIILREN